MKIQKSLVQLANKTGLQIAKVNFRSNGMLVKTGFDIMRGNKILYTLEPVNYTNGDKWLVSYLDGNWPYFKNIVSACKTIEQHISENKTTKYPNINTSPIILYKP